mmetsp:Transcript_9388/g.14311  ORF Transcript_9388/g.14311 Transcript_9388/m.14311 type:complete len:115 (+) Transcript_9388:2351-2695(+)
MENKERQRQKAEMMKNFELFRGRPLYPRSQKKAFKPRIIKKDNLDEQTKDEKEYLGTELFSILQQVKQEFDIDDSGAENEDEQAEEPAANKTGGGRLGQSGKVGFGKPGQNKDL